MSNLNTIPSKLPFIFPIMPDTLLVIRLGIHVQKSQQFSMIKPDLLQFNIKWLLTVHNRDQNCINYIRSIHKESHTRNVVHPGTWCDTKLDLGTHSVHLHGSCKGKTLEEQRSNMDQFFGGVIWVGYTRCRRLSPIVTGTGRRRMSSCR